uniref:Uncharacterized protein n=1 Tax=Onchocerca volvulus TaxID=6282 RepID=A0A8R1U0H5_ONCVO
MIACQIRVSFILPGTDLGINYCSRLSGASAKPRDVDKPCHHLRIGINCKLIWKINFGEKLTHLDVFFDLLLSS